jgi:hypothetical protein
VKIVIQDFGESPKMRKGGWHNPLMALLMTIE